MLCLQKGLTALHIASSHGCRGIVEMLLSADCDIDRQSKVNTQAGKNDKIYRVIFIRN